MLQCVAQQRHVAAAVCDCSVSIRAVRAVEAQSTALTMHQQLSSPVQMTSKKLSGQKGFEKASNTLTALHICTRLIASCMQAHSSSAFMCRCFIKHTFLNERVMPQNQQKLTSKGGLQRRNVMRTRFRVGRAV